LRTWRSDQNLTCASMEAFGLLPSPPISESRPASVGPESSYFDCKSSDESDDSREETETETETDAETTQDEDQVPSALSDGEKTSYQAYRPPGWKEQPRTDVMNVHEAHSKFVRQCESNDKEEPKAQEKSSMSITSPKSAYSEKGLSPRSSPRPQRPRTTTVSSEASWVPSNFSYCERWLQNVPVDRINDKDTPPRVVNRRKVQIVENDPPMPKLDIIPGAKALEEPVVSSYPHSSRLNESLPSCSGSLLQALAKRNQNSLTLLDNHHLQYHYPRHHPYCHRSYLQHQTNDKRRCLPLVQTLHSTCLIVDMAPVILAIQ
jgi:hypothetical protein